MPWLDTGIESTIITHKYALAGYRNRIWNWSSTDIPWLDTGVKYGNWSSTDMPWLDTGIESGICCLQICPGWMQVSNLEITKGW